MNSTQTPIKTKHIVTISLGREFSVSADSARYNTTIWIHRKDANGKESCEYFQTNPVNDGQGKISDASVLRAKHAQNLVLAAQANTPE